MRQEKRKKRRGEERKEKVAKFCFLGMPELYKLTFCIWIRRHRSSQSVNSFVVRFSSLYYSLVMIKKLLDYKLQNVFFGKIPRSEWVNHLPVKVGSKNMIIFIACQLYFLLYMKWLKPTQCYNPHRQSACVLSYHIYCFLQKGRIKAE